MKVEKYSVITCVSFPSSLLPTLLALSVLCLADRWKRTTGWPVFLFLFPEALPPPAWGRRKVNSNNSSLKVQEPMVATNLQVWKLPPQIPTSSTFDLWQEADYQSRNGPPLILREFLAAVKALSPVLLNIVHNPALFLYRDSDAINVFWTQHTYKNWEIFICPGEH